MTTALERYYGALVGRWRGEVQVRLTDEAAFRAATLTFLDRARLWTMNRSGPADIETTLALAPGGARHTTRVTSLGLTLFRTEERLRFDPDGQHFVMEGQQWLAPTWRARHYAGPGQVDETATRASYRVPWLGADLRQDTEIVPEGLKFVQVTAWSRAEFVLHRLDPEPA
jgi:hypothetical protein